MNAGWCRESTKVCPQTPVCKNGCAIVPEGADPCEYVCIPWDKERLRQKVWAKMLELCPSDRPNCFDPWDLEYWDEGVLDWSEEDEHVKPVELPDPEETSVSSVTNQTALAQLTGWSCNLADLDAERYVSQIKKLEDGGSGSSAQGTVSAVLGAGSTLTANAGGVVAMAPGGQNAALGLIVASSAMSLAGTALGLTGKPTEKVDQLQDAVVEGFEMLVEDINKQNQILKGCVENLHAWTESRLISLEKQMFRQFLNVEYMKAVGALSFVTAIRSSEEVASYLGNQIGECMKTMVAALTEVDNSIHQLEEAVSLVSVVDEYMNVCNQFAVGMQVVHNFHDDSSYQRADKQFHDLRGLVYIKGPLRPSRETGFDMIHLVLAEFTRYFTGLETRVLKQKLPDASYTQSVLKRFKYKALSLQREWSWIKFHHNTRKRWPARLNPIGNSCPYLDKKKPTCRVCFGSGSAYGCYERVTGRTDIGQSVPHRYSVTDGYVQCHGGVFYPRGTNTCNFKGIEGYNGLTGQWLMTHHALRGTHQDPQKRENGGPGIPRRRRSAPVAGSCPPWHACCACLR